MPRNIDYTVPAEYEGRKVVHFLRGYCGFSARVMRKVKYSLKLNGEQTRTIDRINFLGYNIGRYPYGVFLSQTERNEKIGKTRK